MTKQSESPAAATAAGGPAAVTMPSTEPRLPAGLVGPEGLLESIFPRPEDRPTVHWLRKMTAARVVPSIKLGSLRMYEPARVLAALRKFEVPVIR